MFDMIKARRESEKKEERYDLFSQLLDASQEETEDGAAQVSDRELVGASTPAVSFLCTLMLYVGNIFIFLLAVSSICVFMLHSYTSNCLGT
jgi:hypothetical protein